MKIFNQIFVFCCLWFSLSAMAQPPVFSLTVDKPVNEVYDKIYSRLEAARFFVVFEPNIGANISRFSKKWGEDYNRNQLTAIRSLVFCNGWYANQVSNLDPKMLGFCPLHITLIEREAGTTALFNRPTVFTQGSAAHQLFINIETEVIAAIKAGMN